MPCVVPVTVEPLWLSDSGEPSLPPGCPSLDITWICIDSEAPSMVPVTGNDTSISV